MEVTRSSIFNEVTLLLEVSGRTKMHLEEQADKLRIEEYDSNAEKL